MNLRVIIPPSQQQHPDYKKYKYLTKEEIEFFSNNGYLKLKSIIPPQECLTYDKEVIQPALKRHANLDENDHSTWSIKNNPKLKTMSTQEVNHDGIPAGIMVYDPENKERDCDPLTVNDGYWSALFDNERLNGILDELHNVPIGKGRTEIKDGGDIHSAKRQQQKRRRWEYLHSGSVGWIHVRLPISICNEQQGNGRQTVGLHGNDESFYIPNGERTWHVDGGHFSPHCLGSIEQSVILLPMIRNVKSNGGGNTVILAGSHKDIAQKLHNEKNGIDKNILNEYCEEMATQWPREKILEAAPSNSGDVWLFHPFLVHSAGRNTRRVDINESNISSKSKDFFRLTFNIGTRWRPSSDGGNDYDSDDCDDSDDVFEEKDLMSILEWTISSSI